jgi:hypothetical protein
VSDLQSSRYLIGKVVKINNRIFFRKKNSLILDKTLEHGALCLLLQVEKLHFHGPIFDGYAGFVTDSCPTAILIKVLIDNHVRTLLVNTCDLQSLEDS